MGRKKQDHRSNEHDRAFRSWTMHNLADILRGEGVAAYNAAIRRRRNLKFVDLIDEQFDGCDLTGLDCTGMRFSVVAGHAYDPRLLVAHADWAKRVVAVAKELATALIEIIEKYAKQAKSRGSADMREWVRRMANATTPECNEVAPGLHSTWPTVQGDAARQAEREFRSALVEELRKVAHETFTKHDLDPRATGGVRVTIKNRGGATTITVLEGLTSQSKFEHGNHGDFIEPEKSAARKKK